MNYLSEITQYIQYAYDKAELVKNKENIIEPDFIKGQKQMALFARPMGFCKDLEYFGFIGTIGDADFIIFRGTDSVADWISNADCELIDFPRGGKVHKGFYKLHEQMIQDIKAWRPKNPLFIAGHSLGAAIATLMADELAYLNPTLYTFSSPRVGNIDFAKNFEALPIDTCRFFNTEDVVPTIPLPIIEYETYQHVGKCIPVSINTGSTINNHAMTIFNKLIESI